MKDNHTTNRKLFADLFANLVHFGQSHRLVRFVLQVERALSLESVAHEAVEDHHGALFWSFQFFQKLARLNGLAHKLEDVVLVTGSLPSTDGRQESHFISVRHGSLPFGIFLIHRRCDRASEFGKLWEPPRVTFEYIFHAGAFRESSVFSGHADDFF